MEEKQQAKQDNDLFVIRKSSVWKISTAVLGILLAITLFTNWFDSPASAPGAPTPAAPNPTGAAVIDMDALVDDDAAIGDEDAPVVIVEFSDFQCPFCRRFWSQTFDQIKSEYVDTGKVRFVYRDFPLSFHPGAMPAAEAAECAGEQGLFWQMHDIIFEEQQKLGQGTVQFSADDIKTWARGVSGLDYASWEECVDSGRMRSEIQKDFADGQAAGITGTPGFVINGKLVSGAQPFSAFQQIIDRELAAQ